MSVTAIILTKNEEKHLQRCLDSLASFVDNIVIVDCFSSDATIQIAYNNGARVLQNEWINHATQFNWALQQLHTADWILRIDADEFVTPLLAEQISSELALLDNTVHGVYINRRMTFLGRPIRYGGVFPIQVLRLFRYGFGECENRWMDEHIRVRGKAVSISGEIVDDNLNSLSWWIDKHNKYSSLEAIEILNLEYGFMTHDGSQTMQVRGEAGIKRWIKENLYARFPLGFRALVYFLYRYVVRLGFLDGKSGTAFHVLQGFWYRYLVDAKVIEVKQYHKKHGRSILYSIECVLGIKLPISNAQTVNER